MTFTLEEELCFEAAEPAEPEEEVDFGVVVGVPAGAANVLDGQLATDGSVIPTILEAGRMSEDQERRGIQFILINQTLLGVQTCNTLWQYQWFLTTRVNQVNFTFY